MKKIIILGVSSAALLLVVVIVWSRSIKKQQEMPHSTSSVNKTTDAFLNFSFDFEDKQPKLANKLTNVISKFSFVFDSKQSHGWAILGTAALGKKVVLLEKNSPGFCMANTVAHKAAGREDPIDLTTLEAEQQCGSVESYSVAVVGVNIHGYRIVSYEKISDNALITAIDTKVKNSSVLDSLKTKAQGIIPGDEAFPIADVKPVLYALNIRNQEVYLVSYDVHRKQHVQTGPRVIVANEQLYPVTGWCSYPYFRVFAFNDAYYLESGSGCCGCGITIQELFEIKDDGVERAWADASYSD